MVSNNKILTVSYGTFSCTLEGFDDSFGTMKAIAEYFRDLASDDRYFGAEPPTPDAEMLARIAEREIARQVDARQERGQIVLRASEQAHDADIAETENSGKTQDHEDKIRQEEQEETAADTTAASHTPRPENEAASLSPADNTSADFEASPRAENPHEEDEAPVSSTPETMPSPPGDESVAAKLRRIRAVVSKGQESIVNPLYTEDEHAEDTSLDTDITTASEDLDAQAENAEMEPDGDALAGEFSPGYEGAIAHGAEPDQAANAAPPQPDEINQETIEKDTSQEDAETEETEGPRAGVLKVKRSDFEEAVTPEIGPDNVDEPIEMIAEETETPNIDIDDWDDDWSTEEESSLSPDEEAELRQELAEVEAELRSDDKSTKDGKDEDDVSSIFAADPSEQPHESRHDRIARREQLYKSAGEQDMKRLIAKTQSEMAEPQAANRRNAIAHLRAAVAATNAEIEAGNQGREDTISEAFRDDLASAVRPKRPKKPTKSGARRPDTGQSAPPLKLVAEQRIDKPEGAEPVRPRRISRANLNEPLPETPTDHAAADKFADFVASIGAQSLGEILEAAASYMTYVEEREDFSRPQLMTKLRDIQGDEFSREDGLRSFGTLLRNGKLRKVGAGRFTASSDIGFKPKARRVG